MSTGLIRDAQLAAPPRPARFAVPLRLYTGLGFLVLVVLWQVLVPTLAVPKYILPTPLDIWSRAVVAWPILWANMLVTLQSVLAGYALAVVVSIPLAMLLAYSPVLEGVAYPILVFLQIIPKIALAPLLVIWFGFGIQSKILITFLLSFFPIVVDSIVGFKSVPPTLVQLASSMRARPLALFFKIRLPAALPNIFAGLKISIALATTAAIVGEFVGADRGLGYLLQRANGDLDTELLFAALCLLSLMGLVLYFIVEAIERYAIPWHVSQRRR
jgi:NitT/TauT family transport system permease protein